VNNQAGDSLFSLSHFCLAKIYGDFILSIFSHTVKTAKRRRSEAIKECFGEAKAIGCAVRSARDDGGGHKKHLKTFEITRKSFSTFAEVKSAKWICTTARRNKLRPESIRGILSVDLTTPARGEKVN
jgi:hypothetical protein